MLQQLVTRLRPAGLIVFHEIDWAGLSSYPPAPTYDRSCRWGMETLRQHGTEPRMGTKLHSSFVAAWLSPPAMRLEALVGGGVNSGAPLHLMAELSATLLPEMERLGVATAEEVAIETLMECMRNEVIANSSVIIGHFRIGAWSRICPAA